jgi:hypothetical protein
MTPSLVSNQWKEHEVAQMLLLAKKQFAYAEFIAKYPATAGRRDFDLTSSVDLFYRNVCSLSAQDGLLLLGSLVSKDGRVMSFWNWTDFVNMRKTKLQTLTDKFSSSGLKTVRDQVVAHQDSNNKNNNFVFTRRSGVHLTLIEQMQVFLQELIDEFYAYTNTKMPIFSPNYFDAGDAYAEVGAIFSLAKPTLTDGFII